MEIFPGRAGILCGMGQVIDLLREVAPQAKVEPLEEGAAMSAKQVVLRIRAHYSAFGLYETAMLGMLAHPSGWATAAREIAAAAAPSPVISFGARHVHPNVSAQLEYAAVVGGCVTGATLAGARLSGKEPSGTIPHSMVLIFGDTFEPPRRSTNGCRARSTASRSKIRSTTKLKRLSASRAQWVSGRGASVSTRQASAAA